MIELVIYGLIFGFVDVFTAVKFAFKLEIECSEMLWLCKRRNQRRKIALLQTIIKCIVLTYFSSSMTIFCFWTSFSGVISFSVTPCKEAKQQMPWNYCNNTKPHWSLCHNTCKGTCLNLIQKHRETINSTNHRQHHVDSLLTWTTYSSISSNWSFSWPIKLSCCHLCSASFCS